MSNTSPAFRPATIDEYITWLRGYLANGGKITHAYDYPFCNADFLTARRNFTTDGECGSAAARIIVPKNCYKRSGDLGHNKLYFMDGFDQRGDWVPVYDDDAFDAVPGVFDAREEAAAHERTFRGLRSQSEHDSDVTRYGIGV